MVSSVTESASAPSKVHSRKKSSRKPSVPGKEVSASSSTSSGDKKPLNDPSNVSRLGVVTACMTAVTACPSNVSRLGKLPGVSITRSPGVQSGKDEKTLAKSSMNDLATQLQVELRKSKENVRPARSKKSSQRPVNAVSSDNKSLRPPSQPSLTSSLPAGNNTISGYKDNTISGCLGSS